VSAGGGVRRRLVALVGALPLLAALAACTAPGARPAGDQAASAAQDGAGRAAASLDQAARASFRPAGAAPAPAAVVPAPAAQAASAAPELPEPASGLNPKPGWAFARQAVVAAHPLAAEAGVRILRQGGNALDAAIAAKLALAVVEPQSSGIGGGAFLLHWNGTRLAAWDGRETAPADADEGLFLQADGRPMGSRAAQIGGRAVGVPGAVRMLEAAHRRDGRLRWSALFAPAIELAEHGFELGPRLHRLLGGEAALRDDPLARALFFDSAGSPLPVGHRLRNPALAAVLRQLAAEGSSALHEGPVAADIVARVRGHAGNPGRLQATDLAAYAPLERAPLCTDWGPRWRVCGFPPPSSGHLTLMQILGLLEQARVPWQPLVASPPGRLPHGLTLDGRASAVRARDAQSSDALSDAHTSGAQTTDARAKDQALQRHAEALHFYAEVSRLAFADRALYVADPAFVPAPAGRWPTASSRASGPARA
jgi:gamma-glutamyltranspeptidase / glutathione hydrolase